MKTEKKCLEELLSLISKTFNDNIYKDCVLFIESQNAHEMSIYRLCIKGERDKNTPFYCGSLSTHITKEDYCNGELVYASVIASEKIA